MRPFRPLETSLLGTNLVEASAGTGKTYTITTLFLRLVLERRLSVDQILVVTFTEAATAELRHRVRTRLREALAAFEGARVGAGGAVTGDEVLDGLVTRNPDHEDARRRLTRAIRGFDEAAITTIHGFCHRVLRENAFESGSPFDVELVADARPLREEVVRDFWATRLYDASPLFIRFLEGRGVDLGGLLGLVARTESRPDVALVPATDRPSPGASSLFDRFERFERAFEDARRLWRSDGAELREILLTSGALNRNKYRLKSLPKWFVEIDGLFGRPGPPPPLLTKRAEHLVKFTTSALAGALKKKKPPPEHPFFDACEALVEADAALTEALDQELTRLRRELVVWAREQLIERKAARRSQFFDDLLGRLDDALSGPDGGRLAQALRSRFPAALIDEFQDTDPVQYRIFRTIYVDASGPGGEQENTSVSLFLIGDPKQAIYAFRGADIFTYLAASSDAGERRFTLERNFRSVPGLLDAVNALFERSPAPFVYERIDYNVVHPGRDVAPLRVDGETPPPFELLFVHSEARPRSKAWGEEHLPGAIAGEIARLLASGAEVDGRAIAPGDIAVLVRTNRQATASQRALRRLRIPSVLRSGESVFHSVEAEELSAILTALVDPGDPAAVRAALATEVLAVDAVSLAALGEDEAGWDAWNDALARWSERWRVGGVVAALRALFEEREVRSRTLARVDGERRMTNLLHLGEQLHKAETSAHLGPAGLVRWLDERRQSDESVGDDAQLRLESDARAVQLVTIHKSKGLEYPVVYCPFMWDGALLKGADAELLPFHDPDAGMRLTLDLGSDEREAHEALAEREVQAENLRLLYVALTRARLRCVVVWGAFNGAERSPLAYLLHGPTASMDGAEALAWTGAHVKALSSEALWAELDELVIASGGGISVRELPLDEAATYTPSVASGGSLRERRLSRPIRTSRRRSSFSGIVRGSDHPSLPPSALHDAETDASAAAETVPLDDFPTGTRAGLFFHEVLERADFTAGRQALERVVIDRLGAWGFDSERWARSATDALVEVLATPLPGADGPLRLGDVSLGQRLSELPFILPVGRSGAQPFSAARLASVFSRRLPPTIPGDYPARLRALTFEPLMGFLSGIIDLVFEYGGRMYLVDYKSNHLGPRFEDYAPPRLGLAMGANHYVLQYHLYTVALHRYLATRLRDYDYERDFGGVLYLFLRGMSPALGAGAGVDTREAMGVFHDRPSLALLRDLSAALEGA